MKCDHCRTVRSRVMIGGGCGDEWRWSVDAPRLSISAHSALLLFVDSPVPSDHKKNLDVTSGQRSEESFVEEVVCATNRLVSRAAPHVRRNRIHHTRITSNTMNDFINTTQTVPACIIDDGTHMIDLQSAYPIDRLGGRSCSVQRLILCASCERSMPRCVCDIKCRQLMPI